MALTVNRLGMSLMRMGKSSERVRFLDEVDLTFSLDSRSSSSQQMTNMEINAKPIVFRASYRDINIITTIVNKAISLYGSSQKSSPAPDESAVTKPLLSRPSAVTKSNASKGGKSRIQPVGKARVLVSKEKVYLLKLT